jgi:hypothetical protein
MAGTPSYPNRRAGAHPRHAPRGACDLPGESNAA